MYNYFDFKSINKVNIAVDSIKLIIEVKKILNFKDLFVSLPQKLYNKYM